MIPNEGKVGGLHGRKQITIAGVAAFLGGSARFKVATSMIGLIDMRRIQELLRG